MNANPETIGTTPAYWIHKVGEFPGPVAVSRMAQLIDFDDRLYEAARVVYRFLISWYHDAHGDALMSMRHVSNTMKQRAPDGASVPSRSAVQRAIIALIETGWVVRTFKGRGKGKGASRYVPVLNVLEVAARGNFPQPTHDNGTVEPTHDNGTAVSHATGTVEAQLAHSIGTKTHIPDPPSEAETGISMKVTALLADGLGATAAAGFDRIWKAYGKYGNKVASRAAFEAITNPDVNHIAERADSWRASAKPGQRRMPLERWLAEEKYDQADRKIHKSASFAPKTTKPDFAPVLKRRVMAVVESVGSTTSKEDGAKLLEIFYRTEDDIEVFQLIILESPNLREQEDGQVEFHEVLRAIGLDAIENAEDLVGQRIALIIAGNQFESVARDWNERPATFARAA